MRRAREEIVGRRCDEFRWMAVDPDSCHTTTFRNITPFTQHYTPPHPHITSLYPPHSYPQHTLTPCLHIKHAHPMTPSHPTQSHNTCTTSHPHTSSLPITPHLTPSHPSHTIKPHFTHKNTSHTLTPRAVTLTNHHTLATH